MNRNIIAFTFLPAMLALIPSAFALADEVPLPDPTIRLSTYEVDFGDVAVNTVDSVGITIRNTSRDWELTVYSVKTKEPFSDSLKHTPFTIRPNSFRKFKVLFQPTEAIDYSGICTISSDAVNEPLVIVTLEGNGVPQ